jgi:hypothetical protein
MGRIKKFCGKFCKKLIGVLRYAANGFAAMELDRYSRRGELLGLAVKHRYRFMCVDMEDPVKQWYGWQKIRMGLRN